MKFYIIAFLILVSFGVDIDKNTFSNYKEVKMQHLHIEWLLNLRTKIIDGSAEYTFKVTTVELKEVLNFSNMRSIWIFIKWKLSMLIIQTSGKIWIGI